MPVVSVIIPTYNHRDYVWQTCESVFRQTFTDYELIIVNDGSPDDTADVLRPLVDAGKVRYIHQPNGGQASARNRGLEAATGEFIAFLDDDDVWLPDKLEWQVNGLRSNPKAALLYGYCRHLNNDDTWRWPGPDAPTGNVQRRFLRENWIVSPGQTLIRAQALRDSGSFDPNMFGSDDWDLYIRLAGWGEFIFENRAALCYRRHATNASRDDWRMYHNSEKIRHKHLGRIPTFSTYRDWFSSRRWITLQFITGCIEKADDLSRRGRRAAALAQWARIVRCRPELLVNRQVLRGIGRSLLA